MKKYFGISIVFVLAALFLVSGFALAQKAGFSDARTKNAFQQIKTAADSNKDGTITEDEYVSQARKLMKK